MKKGLILLVSMAIVAAVSVPAFAESQDMERRLDQMNQQLEAQNKLIQEMDARLRQAEDPAFRAQVLSYEERLTELRNELRQATGNDLVPGWVTGLNFFADIRVRYNTQANDDRGYVTSAVTGFPVRVAALDEGPRNRMEYRVRFGTEKQWGDDWSAGFRVDTTVNGATSNDATLGDYFGEDAIGIGRAWIAYHPKCVDGLKVVAGKWENPFYGSPMVWDPDVNPEGIYGQYRFKGCGDFVPFATIALMIADERANADDILGLAYQVGFDWKLRECVKWVFAASFYDWDGFEDAVGTIDLGEANDAAGAFIPTQWPNGLRASTLYGNTVAVNTVDGTVFYNARDFNIVDFYNEVVFDVPFGQDRTIEFAPFIDYAFNTEDQVSSPGRAVYRDLFAGVNRVVDDEDFNDAWSIGFRVGKAAKQGDFQFNYRYAHIEPNAVVGRFADNEFGFANTVGHEIGATYKLHDNIDLTGTLYLTKPIFDIDHTSNDEQYLNLDVVFTY